jgi:hypothetical protein
VSHLVNNRVDRFTVDTLINMLGRAGVGVQLSFTSIAARRDSPRIGTLIRLNGDPVILNPRAGNPDIPCTAIAAGEIEVPLPLRRDERVLDVTPALIHSEEVRLADISVIQLGDRSVKLRFSVGGGSPSPWTRECQQPQALITLRMTLVTTTRN